MSNSSFNRRAAIIIAFASAVTFAPAAQARDFFSAFFSGFSAPERGSSVALPFAAEFGETPSVTRRVNIYGSGGSSAYCVRTCDGRYFPITITGGQSKAEACKSFCPASETRVVFGGNIDSARTESGKPYSELPNAFKYRNELVADCTCNGKDSGGLAHVNVENDPTVRKGDLVAGANGIVVATRTKSDRNGVSVNYSPVSRSTQARFERLPVVAAQ